ncbi:MAG: glycosyltransferase family 39 protein [Bryobacteraceae bacterium]
MTALMIAASALFTGGSALAAGLLLLQLLQIRLSRQEQYLYGFLTGSAILSSLVFLACAVSIAYPLIFAGIGIGLIAACLMRRAHALPEESLPPLPFFWKWLLVMGMLAYGTLYLMTAMAPETSPDGTAYHLGLVAQYLRQHGFGRITTDMYANLSLGIEMLFLFAFSFGKHSSAAMVHWLFTMTLPLLMVAYARRFGIGKAGVVGALLVFFSPVFGADGSSAYIDIAMASVIFGCFGLLQIWDEKRERPLLVAAGLLAGFAYACKLTAFLAVPYAIVFVFYRAMRRREKFLVPLMLVAVSAAAMIAPWMIKNAVTVGNPLSPFFNKAFPNPYIRISFEEEYVSRHRHYDALKSAREIPLEVTVRGGMLQGLLGPIFLLAPLSLFALRWPAGRRLIPAAVFFALPFAGNIGTRFLLPSLPFLSIALGLVLSEWRAMAPAVVLFHGLISWPDVVKQYSDPYAWKLDRFRWKQAFRIEPEEVFLKRMVPSYKASKLVEKHVPPDGRVFTYAGLSQAYCDRQFLVAYQGGLNNVLGEILITGFASDMQPLRHWTYRFTPAVVRKLRLLQTVQANDLWSVTEFRVFSGATEIPRAKWRLRASPNPWDVQYAFDNSPVTRWKTFEKATSGMYLEVDLGKL